MGLRIGCKLRCYSGLGAAFLVLGARGGVGTLGIVASAAPIPFAGVTQNGVYPQESFEPQAQPVSPVRPHD